ncbi:UNVERIFIED_CONTAM: hypothetical protein PYX00_007268 [Menopon gallinae]|uniref:Signal transducer and activator of transcription n=1 Tax=Menopon gallinae TaxID=328185 RepID=A0AAW2HID4_9NEOP
MSYWASSQQFTGDGLEQVHQSDYGNVDQKMSLWTKSQQLPAEALQQVREMYGEHFPIEVRHFLANWIEEKMWNDIDPDNPQHERYVVPLVNAFIVELEAKASSFTSEDLFLTRLKLMEAAAEFRRRYSQEPHSLIRLVKQCLNNELKLVQQFESGIARGLSLPIMPDAMSELTHQLETLRRRTQATAEELRKMEQEQEAFAIHYHDCTKINAHLQQLESQNPGGQPTELQKKLKLNKDKIEQVLNQQVSSLVQFKMTLADKLKETITLLTVLQNRILDDELIRWKRDQQLAGNGAQFNSHLDSIQEWCESLAEVIWSTRQQIQEAERLKQKIPLDPPGLVDILPNLSSQITELLSSLVTSTFIIEKQPPQVMKTNTRFTSTVRLLVGGKLNVHMSPPQVKVTIISEAQANSLLKNYKTGKGEASGEILNNTSTMEYHQSTRQLSASFRNMQLKKIKRAEKKGTESVMDEKFSLLFQSSFSVGGGELVFQVWTLSLPVVVIVHGNQEPHAWATVTWDNAFAEAGRVPFVVPDKVPWSDVASALNVKFKAATGRCLTDENLKFLGEKAFRSTQPTEYGPLLLTWSQFCKEPLPERSFTFWEWFYAVMKLTREHLRGPWNDGAIVGFVRKKEAEEMLMNCPNGTFLLRFSDSELGGVTIAWVGAGAGDVREVLMLQPFTSKDFSIRSLADRISDLSHLVYLFPDIRKENAFGRYYTPMLDNQPTSTNGYVKPLLVTHVPGIYSPGTSQVFHPQSPDTRDTPSVAGSVTR